VVGGGAWADDFGASQVVLTRLEPIHGGPQDCYVATAEEPAAGFSGDWWLSAYALCAGAEVAVPTGASALAG
jgi:hypothetical protein